MTMKRKAVPGALNRGRPALPIPPLTSNNALIGHYRFLPLGQRRKVLTRGQQRDVKCFRCPRDPRGFGLAENYLGTGEAAHGAPRARDNCAAIIRSAPKTADSRRHA